MHQAPVTPTLDAYRLDVFADAQEIELKPKRHLAELTFHNRAH